MQTYCGLDFGTSNSTIGVSLHGTCQLVPLENNKVTLRSAIFCDNELKQWLFGQTGIDHYLEGVPGRLMMALKSVLGSPLMDDKTVIFNEYLPYSDVLGHFIQYIKTRAEQTIENSLTHVVLGRPVHFHDQDKQKDALAQNTLEAIALKLGFKEVSFQYEPIAAAIAYETTIQKEQLALIIDIGGGTSDFSIIRLRPGVQTADRRGDVLANCGIHIAGTDFDQCLSIHSVMPLLGMHSLIRGSSHDIEFPSSYFHELTTWHTLSHLYSPANIAHVRSLQMKAYEESLIERLLTVLQKRAGHHILDAVETAKQHLSAEQESTLDLSFIEENLDQTIARQQFNVILAEHVRNILETIQQTVKIANVKPAEISALFYTGGSSKIPLIRDQINRLFPNAEVIQGDAFGSVGLGLTIDAARRYGK